MAVTNTQTKNVIENNFKLTSTGERFINYVCGISVDDNTPKNNPNGNNLLVGNNGALPYSTGVPSNQQWRANIKNSQGEVITTNAELAPILIELFNKWGQKYGLDPNVLAAQAYAESGFKMWIYSNVSTASGVNQFTMETIYGVIVDNFSTIVPKMTASEIALITNGLTDPNTVTSYRPSSSQQTAEVAKANRPILHQNVIDNPSVMIKAQARYMKYFSTKCEKLASTSLFCYSRGSAFTAPTYTEAINKAIKKKGEAYIKEGVNYVMKIFGMLGDKDNSIIPLKNYKPQGEWFGYKQLNLGTSFDAHEANVAESAQYGLTEADLDDLTITSDSRYRFIYFPESEYRRENSNKNQIVLHHTVSGGGKPGDSGIEGDVLWWQSKGERVATSFIIARDGRIYQLFSTNYWAYHLGINPEYPQYDGLGFDPSNFNLNKNSIGIEIDSWGGLVQDTDGLWYPAKMDRDGNDQIFVPNKDAGVVTKVTQYNSTNGYPKGFRGFFGFETYTDEQISAVEDLIFSIYNKFPNINLTYHEDIWDFSNKANGCPGISSNALGGEESTGNGVWTHVSYRADKSDCHPQDELVDMLKGLESKVQFSPFFENNSKGVN